MEQNEEKIEKGEELLKGVDSPKKGLNLKVILFGLPLFMLQLVVVYFVTANVLLNKIKENEELAKSDTTQVKAEDTLKAEKQKVELGKFVYVVDDLIINPAQTDGKRLLLSSIGFDIPTEQSQQELKEKEVIVKDAIISVLGSKTMDKLGNSAYRDTLRIEISHRLAELMPEVKINNVYFSKYILQ